MSILYYSTNHKSEKVTFQQALLKGLAPDNGLYMPESLPKISREELKSFHNKPYHEIAFEVGKRFLAGEIDDAELAKITRKAYDFEIPLEKVYGKNYVMRLDQGPTASFKDFAGRMMGQLMQYFLQRENKKVLILTATSGDTGSAVANAFYGLDNVKVLILYPENEVTDRQRKQMTTLHKNIDVLALNGTFDNCQALVKKAFMDKELDVLSLSSANSINIGRLIPQSMYYIYAYSRLQDLTGKDSITFSVPSGNFGNLMGGLLAKHIGLPVDKFVISTNANDEVPVYFDTNIYKLIEPSKRCISSAMNVGHPSNMARIIALYGGQMNENGVIIQQPDIARMKNDMYATSITDNDTKAMLKEVYAKYKVLLEPHGSVAWAGLERYRQENHLSDDKLCVSLETAHPAKFPKEINEILNIDPQLPPSLEGLDKKEEKMTPMENDYSTLKKFLLEKYS